MRARTINEMTIEIGISELGISKKYETDTKASDDRVGFGRFLHDLGSHSPHYFTSPACESPGEPRLLMSEKMECEPLYARLISDMTCPILDF